VILALGLAACGQAPESEQAAAEPAPAAAAEATVQERGVKSIDAEGNVAPFGMASRQPVELTLAAAPVSDAIEPAANAALYGVHCGACHGPEATGVEGLGLNLVESQLVAASSPAELAAFLKEGRPADSPDSVTKVPMPSFAWMNDSDLANITGHLKSL